MKRLWLRVGVIAFVFFCLIGIIYCLWRLDAKDWAVVAGVLLGVHCATSIWVLLGYHYERKRLLWLGRVRKGMPRSSQKETAQVEFEIDKADYLDEIGKSRRIHRRTPSK